MNRLIAFLFPLLLLTSCCSCRERYAPFLEHVEVSLRDSVAPLLSEALVKGGRIPEVIATDVGEVTDLADACERIRTHGVDAWAPGSQGEDE